MGSKNKIIKAGITYTLCNVILKGLSFFTVPLFIRLLTTEEFGQYNVFISFEGIIYIFSGLCIHASIKNAYYDYKNAYEDYVKNCVYLDFFNSIIILLLSYVAYFTMPSLLDLDFLEVNLLVLGGFCNALVTIYTSKLIMEYNANNFVVVSLFGALASVALSLLLIFTLCSDNHYYGRLIGGVLGQVAVSVFICSKIFKNGFSKIDKSIWKYGVKISLPIIPHGLSQHVLSTASRIIIKYIYNASLAGIFSLTYTISLAPRLVFTSVSRVWEPWFFEKMDQKAYHRIRSVSTDVCLGISILFVLFSCIIPEFVKIIATEDYYDAIDISIIVMMSVYFSTLYYIPCEIEYFYKKTTYIASSTIVCAVVNIGLNILLMHFFSYKVAAYVMLISYFLYFVFHMYMSYVIMKRQIFDLRLMIIFITVAMALMALNVVFLESIIIRASILLTVLIISGIHYRQVIGKILSKLPVLKRK